MVFFFCREWRLVGGERREAGREEGWREGGGAERGARLVWRRRVFFFHVEGKRRRLSEGASSEAPARTLNSLKMCTPCCVSQVSGGDKPDFSASSLSGGWNDATRAENHAGRELDSFFRSCLPSEPRLLIWVIVGCFFLCVLFSLTWQLPTPPSPTVNTVVLVGRGAWISWL